MPPYGAAFSVSTAENNWILKRGQMLSWRGASLQRHLAVLQGSKQRCSSKQQNYYCGINLFTNKWDELHTFSVTQNAYRGRVSHVDWSQTTFIIYTKLICVFLSGSGIYSIVYYLYYIILLWHYIVVWVCLFSWPPDPTCRAVPAGNAAPWLQFWSDCQTVPCLFIRSRQKRAGLIVKYANCIVLAKRPGLIRFGSVWDIFFEKNLKKRKDPLLLLLLLLSFLHASDLVAFPVVVLILVALLLLDIIQR